MPVLPDYTELDPGPRHSVQDSYQVPSMPRNPIPDALEGMGQALMRGGTDYAREQRYWARQDAAQNRQDIAQSKFDANSTYEDFKAKQIDALNQAAQNAPAGAPNFTQNFLQQYDAAGKDMWKGVSQAPDQVLAPLNSRVMKDREWFAKQAQAYEAKQGRAFYVGKINDFTTNVLAGISHDSTPENFGDSVKRVEEQINALPGYFTPDDKMKFDSMARVQLLKGYAMAHPDQFQGQMENFANTPFGQKLMQQLPQYTPTGVAPPSDQPQGGQAQPGNTMPDSAVSFFQERYAGTRQGHFNVDPAFGSRLQNALNDAEQATGGLSTILSLRRTNAEQASAYRNYMMGGGIAAKPGHSLHETGDAADLRQDVVWQWLRSPDPKTGQPRAANYGLEFLPDRLNDKGHIQLTRQYRGNGATVMPASAPANGTVAPSQADATLPAGMRNNNPGNLKFTGDAWQRSNLPGMVGPSQNTDQGSPQIVFDSPQSGMNATVHLAQVKYSQGLDTVNKIITSSNGWTPGYQPAADNIAKMMGVGPNDHIDLNNPDTMQKFVRALVTQEHGDKSKLYTDDFIKSSVQGVLSGKPVQVADSGQIVSDATANAPITPDSGAPEIFHGIAPKDLFQIQSEVIQAQKGQAAAAREQAKQLNDDAANGYVSRILKNDPKDVANIVQEIAADPSLTNFETKKTLADLADKYQVGTSRQLGPGFSSALGDITSNKITDVNDIYKRALPGGDLTLDGADRLVGIMQKGQKSTDSAAVNTTRDAMLKYAHSKLSFDQEMMFPGLPPLKDAKGEQIFNAQFVPKFEAAFDQWIKDGKNPYEFLTQKNIDTMVDGLRPANQMNADRVNAGMDQSSGETMGNIPAAPKGANAKNWAGLLQMAPIRPDGSRLPPDKWGEALSILWNASQTQSLEDFKKTTDLFNSHFAVSGTDAKTVLEQMAPEAAP